MRSDPPLNFITSAMFTNFAYTVPSVAVLGVPYWLSAYQPANVWPSGAVGAVHVLGSAAFVLNCATLYALSAFGAT